MSQSLVVYTVDIAGVLKTFILYVHGPTVGAVPMND